MGKESLPIVFLSIYVQILKFFFFKYRILKSYETASLTTLSADKVAILIFLFLIDMLNVM